MKGSSDHLLNKLANLTSNIPVKKTPGSQPVHESKSESKKKKVTKLTKKTTIWIYPMPCVQSVWPDRSVPLFADGALFRYDTIKAYLKAASEANQTVVVCNRKGSRNVPTVHCHAILCETSWIVLKQFWI